MLTLAYIQHYNCNFIPGRCLSNTHLRRLVAWLGCPDDTLRTIRRQPILAAHIALLHAANLLRHNDAFWYLLPDAFNWLNQPATTQCDQLLKPIANGQYTIAIEALGLGDTVPIDMVAYVQQQLARQAQQPQSDSAQSNSDTVGWLKSDQDSWRLHLPQSLPLKNSFHLLQIGDWLPQRPLTVTPLTFAQAVQRGYSLTHIVYLLETTTNQSLSDQQQRQILDWYRRHDTYRLRPVTLLSVKQPEQLASIIKNGHLRPHIQKQISPRHAIAAPAIQPLLQKWAIRRGYRLNAPVGEPTPTAQISPTGYQWLGLQLLTTLGQITPLPCSPPHAELEALAAHISPEEQSQLAALVEQISANLQRAIRGRDAFFPARKTIPPQWVETVRRAIANDQTISLAYQALGECSPSCRHIQPLRLEERGSLFYLYAYCFRAEANRTFRLDRVKELKMSNEQ
ncbi:MAG: WYL domain-containing protein [Chloroflexi bacterium]|nr:WYL domain-containing protein [Chloroflexota bacterium]